jgi:signal transduction histidine kinase
MSKEDLASTLNIVQMTLKTQALIIDDLLDISRAASHKLRLELVDMDLKEMIISAISIVSPSSSDKKVHLDWNPPNDDFPFHGDKTRLQQAIWNILINAIKFTPTGGQILIGLTKIINNNLITITDTGRGIDKKHLHEVFDQFKQVESQDDHSNKGLGLGLSIAKHIIELHKGNITVSSEGKGKGTTFIVALPSK